MTAGAFWRALPDVVAYEATVPLVYESQWYEPSKVEPQKQNLTCNLKMTKECILINELENLQNTYKKEFQNLEESWSPRFL